MDAGNNIEPVADLLQKNQLAAIFEHATLGIVVVNETGIIRSINPFACKQFGYKEKEISGQPIEMLIPSRFKSHHVHHRINYVNQPKNRPMGVGMDLFAVKKDGIEFPVEVSLGNYTNNGEKYVIAFISDISIRKQAELQLAKLNDELEQKVALRTAELTNAMHQLEQSRQELSKTLDKERELGELKSRFVSMASHEFRTPLSTILSSTNLIEKYTGVDEQPNREKHLHRITSSVKMLTDLLNDFLSVGKIEEGKIQVRKSEFNIKETIDEIVEQMKASLKKGQHINYMHVGADIIELDSSMLKHIIMNLVSNAVKFSLQDTPISIDTSNSDQKFILRVKDSGIGITEEDQRHLMERFFRSANAGNIQGTGLGLHIVAKYTELLNGNIECNSQLGAGTTFTLTFNLQ